MPSQLPEHAVVSLLKRCFEIPRCQAPRFRQHTFSRSSSRPSPKLRPAGPCIESQQRCYSTQNRATSGREASQQIEYLGPRLPNRRRYPLPVLAKQQTRSYSPGNQPPEKRFAVLGGGITGLSTAHYLTQELPNAKVTIYESGDKLGGWLRSKYVDVANGRILFEQGPRTLRPGTLASVATLEMVEKLGLEDELLLTSKNSDAARNRFIYYPDHLVKMPGPGQDLSSMLWTVLTESLFKGTWQSLFEMTRDARPSDLEDESIASFANRRFGGPDIGDNIISAVVHGIYAGDIYQLSAKSIFRRLWDLEGQYGSIMQGTATSFQNNVQKARELRDARDSNRPGSATSYYHIQEQMKAVSVYTFKEGIGQLSSALETSLKTNPNVEIKTGDKVTLVAFDPETQEIEIQTALKEAPKQYTHVISTLSGRTLSNLTSALPSLSGMHAVTVMVVNLYYSDPNLLPERGFGYLIPRSIPFEQNPECALGVVFDSDAVQGQDTAPGTKVTVMLGGHWWDGFSSYPDEEEGAAMAKTVLYRHLGISVEPEAVNVGLQKECIPQYVVGHEKRLRTAHLDLLQDFKGKLKVAGNSYTGVGLNDCVMAAKNVVEAIKNEGVNSSNTGLEGL